MALDADDIERLREIFVAKEHCKDTTDEINKKLANDKTELALIRQTLNTITWVSKTTLGAVLVAIVGAVLALVLKS